MIDLIQTADQIIAVDIVGSFGALNAAEETDYPVEDGSRRADHKILGLQTVELEITQSEHPFNDPDYSLQDLSLSSTKPTTRSYTPKLDIREVQTRVTSPFLLVGTTVRRLVSAGVSRLTQAAGGGFGLQIGQPQKSDFSLQTYQAANPRDRGGELYGLLKALYEDEEATCTITYRGQTFPALSLISLGLNYERAGLTSFSCSFKQRRTATIGTTTLFDPAEVAHKDEKKLGKGKDQSKEAGDGKPKSVLKAIVG